MPEDPEDDDPPEEEDGDGSDEEEEEEASEDEDASEDGEEVSDGDEDASEDGEEVSDGDEDASEDGEEVSDEDEDASEDGEEVSDGDEDASEDTASADDAADTEEDLEAAADDGQGDGAVVLPELDEEVFGSREEWGGDDEDFEDDQGDWSADDYREVATTLFGDHEFFGDTAEQRYIDEGFTPIDEDDHEIVRGVREQLPDATTVQFFERDGQIVPRGFLTSTALALLEAAFPALDLAFLRITVPKRPNVPTGGDTVPPRRGLPPELANVEAKDSVDLRKYATPIGDQGTTSRCAAFAWTHALEMLANMHARPFPRLACSFTMVRFQQRQGDFRDFRYAWKGGDGTSGTWEPGAHLFVNGTCRHDHWPNDEKEPRVSIEEMEADARNHTFEADVYDVTLEEMKKLLSAGLPVQISMATGDAFQDIGRDGVMKVAEAPKGQHGYHAMLCVGYVGNYFIVKNSWGEDWGDSGYCYIPKKVLAESEPEAVAIVPRGRMAPPPAPNVPPTGGAAPNASSARGAPQRTQAIPAMPAPPSFARPPVAQPPPPPVSQRQVPAPPSQRQVPAPPPQQQVPAPPSQQQPPVSLVVCPRCSKQVPLGKFCRECGGPLPAPSTPRNFCSSCGARREGAGRFCARCGAKHE